MPSLASDEQKDLEVLALPGQRGYINTPNAIQALGSPEEEQGETFAGNL
jgi:hypothetical protein